MAHTKIPENVKQFIFEHIDSVEQLEVLLFLRAHADRSYSPDEISKEFRSSTSSVNARLISLKNAGIVEEKDPSLYQYKVNPQHEDTLTLLVEEYKTKKYLIMELIFSPLKRMKKFADSFVFGSGEKKKGDEDG